MIKVNLTDKVAIVTGASRGLGASIAKSLAQNGAIVVLNYINGEENNVESVLEETQKFSNQSISFKCDVTKEDEVEEMVNITVSKFKKIDFLVNNAGIHQHLTTEKLRIEDWNKVINVNLTGTFLCSKAVIDVMKNNNFGRIVNISSLDAFVGTDHESHYAASKAGVIGFTKSLALELAANNVAVNAVAPGNILTPMLMPMEKQREEELLRKIPVKKLGLPDDVSNATLFLLSEEASFITGQTIHVNGGLGMI